MTAGRIELLAGDMLERLADLAPASIDACVTDPPYHLASIVKRFGGPGAAPAKGGAGLARAYKGLSRGFMGKEWDGGDIAFDPDTWRAVFRVLKPGAHLAAFSGSKLSHRQTTAIEAAGFEIRDSLFWLYGTGFPKSRDVAKDMPPEMAGDWDGWGTALKPACEPICLARKPLAESSVARQVAATGTGALNIGATRIGDERRAAAFTSLKPSSGNRLGDPATSAARRGTQGEKKQYVGRWPANVLHDGSAEVTQFFPVESGGTAARFFYGAKATPAERRGSSHPTIKPLDLMRWLVRLITPPGGLVLDPFAGTGSTGWAAAIEGARAVLVEREPEYQADILKLIADLEGGQVDTPQEQPPAQRSLFGSNANG